MFSLEKLTEKKSFELFWLNGKQHLFNTVQIYLQNIKMKTIYRGRDGLQLIKSSPVLQGRDGIKGSAGEYQPGVLR